MLLETRRFWKLLAATFPRTYVDFVFCRHSGRKSQNIWQQNPPNRRRRSAISETHKQKQKTPSTENAHNNTSLCSFQTIHHKWVFVRPNNRTTIIKVDFYFFKIPHLLKFVNLVNSFSSDFNFRSRTVNNSTACTSTGLVSIFIQFSLFSFNEVFNFFENLTL
jgi:hypothetical protein